MRTISPKLVVLGLAAAAALAPARGAAAGTRIVIMPFEEFGTTRVADKVSERVVAQLARKGYDLVLGDPVEAFFERERVRYVDSLAPAVLDKMLKELDATRVFFGVVLSASERPLHVTVAARMLGAGGRLVWTDVVTITPEHAVGLLSPKKISSFPELLHEAARQLADRIPEARSRRFVGPRPSPVLVTPSRGPVVYRAPSLRAPADVVVLPPTNYTYVPRAARVILDLVARRVGERTSVRAVEPAAIRQAAVAEDLRLSRRLDVEDMKKLQKSLGARLYLRTTIFKFEPGPDSPVGEAAVALEMTLIDASTEKIVWTAYHERRSEEYVVPLKMKAVRDVLTLADQTVAEMVRTLWN
jgi:TolB-like protein